MITQLDFTNITGGVTDHYQVEALIQANDYLAGGEVHLAETHLVAHRLAYPLLEVPVTEFVALSMLGEVYHHQGRLHLAAATYQPLLDLVDKQPLNAVLFHFFDRLCRLYYEWNHLAKATQYYRWCLATIEQNNLPAIWSFPALIGMAWSLWARGMTNSANQQMQKADVLVQRTQHPGLIKQMNIQRARLRLREGNLSAAARLLNSEGQNFEETYDYQNQATQLILARMLIHEQKTDQALGLLEVYGQAALKAGRESDLIEILVLQALAYQRQADAANASAALANALCRAEREGFVRSFVDEGAVMMALLQQSSAQGITLLYVHDLLAAFPQGDQNADEQPHVQRVSWPEPNRLVEPLSLRELEVLSLVAVGESNKDIAHRLKIASTTVKKHIGNILAKLDVRNRTQAAAKARALGLC